MMMKLVISMFDDYKIAEQVIDDLVKNGFSDNDIHMTGNSAKGHHSTGYDHQKLGKHLQDEGVPDEEAGYYAEGVRRGGTLVTVSAADEWADKAADIMRRYEVVDIDSRVDYWRNEGWTGYDPNSTAYTTEQMTTERQGYLAEKPAATQKTADDHVSIPVTEEELKVGKRTVRSGGVRVHSHVIEKPVEETVALREEHVSVERRPVNRPVSDAERAAAFKDEVIETEEFREEAVVSKEARVVEEVVVGKEATQHEETVRDTVRRTDVEVENLADRNVTGTTSTVDYTDDFRNHYQTHYADRGETFDNYHKAYQYGYDLHSDSRYKNKDWSSIEPNVRKEWEDKNPNTWQSFKDSVRYGWEKLKGNR